MDQQPSKQCPNCDLINPGTAQRCDCGYDFRTDRLEGSLLHPDQASDVVPAPLARRLLGFFVDLVVFNIGLFGGASLHGLRALVTVGQAAYILPLLAYYILFEGFLQRTPGKFIAGTQVVTETGARPGWDAILLRTFIRLVPFEPLSGLGSEPCWWHDRWAKTRVVLVAAQGA